MFHTLTKIEKKVLKKFFKVHICLFLNKNPYNPFSINDFYVLITFHLHYEKVY